MTSRHGYTLLELALALTLATTLGAMSVPALRHGRDVLAVRAAAHDLAGMIAFTRAMSIGHGGATLVIDPAQGTAHVTNNAGALIGDVRHFEGLYNVDIRAGGTSPVRLRYDALGIGRLAAASLRVQRGAARATVTVSAYGRVRL